MPSFAEPITPTGGTTVGISDLTGGGLISAAGSIIGAGINAASTAATNQQNYDLTQQAWTRDDNAMQRRVKDLKKAGLNPMLATGQSAGNTSPIPMKAWEGMPNVGEAMLSGMATAQSIKERQQGIVQSQAQIDLINSQRDKVEREKEGVSLDNMYKDQTLKNRVGLVGSEATIRGKDAEAALATYQMRIAKYTNEAGITANKLTESASDAVIKMNQALYSEEAARLGIDEATTKIAMDRARAAAVYKNMDKTDADIAIMAYAIKASGMNKAALEKLGIAPIMIELLMRLVETGGKVAASAVR